MGAQREPELPLLAVRNLRTHFFLDEGVLKAVDGVNLEIKKGETLGLVGESGSGKSMTALSILRLVPNPGRVVSGEIFFSGQDLLRKKEEEMRKIRGEKIAIIFQDPTTSLNPTMKVGNQIVESIRLHQNKSRREALEEAIRMMESVGVADSEIRVKDYPHQLSGGMRQRVMIAIALSCQPEFLIADEPTTNLDVTVEAQILDLIVEMKRKINSSLLYITHNLGVIAEISDKVSVMYAGKIMESAPVEDIFESPSHPYSQALIKSFPSIGTQELTPIPGTVADLISPPSGCKFHPRCEHRTDVCSKQEPGFIHIDREHYVACHFPQQ